MDEISPCVNIRCH